MRKPLSVITRPVHKLHYIASMAYDKYVIIYEYTAVLYSCWTFNYKVAQDLLVLGMQLVANVNLESLVCWAPVTFQVQCFFAPPSLASWYEYLYWWLCAEFSVTYSIKKNGLGYCILSCEWHCWAKKKPHLSCDNGSFSLFCRMIKTWTVGKTTLKQDYIHCAVS